MLFVSFRVVQGERERDRLLEDAALAGLGPPTSARRTPGSRATPFNANMSSVSGVVAGTPRRQSLAHLTGDRGPPLRSHISKEPGTTLGGMWERKGRA